MWIISKSEIYFILAIFWNEKDCHNVIELIIESLIYRDDIQLDKLNLTSPSSHMTKDAFGEPKAFM